MADDDDNINDALAPARKPRLRAAFVGFEAVKAMKAMGGENSVVDGARCAFHLSSPARKVTPDWARGIDVVVLGAAGEQRRTALMQAAAAAIPHVVILSEGDDAERRHREMCAEIGLDGDSAVVVNDLHDPARLIDTIDQIAVPRLGSSVAAGIVARTTRASSDDAWLLEVRAEVLRGSFTVPHETNMLAGGVWQACKIVDGLGVHDVPDDGSLESFVTTMTTPRTLYAGDQGSMFVSCADMPEEGMFDVLLSDERMPLTTKLPLNDAFDPDTWARLRTLRVFLGWTTAEATLTVGELWLNRPHPAPLARRYWVLPGMLRV